jgi:hypothetical protein
VVAKKARPDGGAASSMLVLAGMASCFISGSIVNVATVAQAGSTTFNPLVMRNLRGCNGR